MSKIFDKIKIKRPASSKFDLSHERKFSLNMGQLIPMMVQEVVPGDKFRVKSEIMIRFAPLLAPVMHRVNVYTHYFFVPNRLTWDEWEPFITGGREGTSAPVAPYFTINTANAASPGLLDKGTLADYMGVPRVPEGVTVVDETNVSALPFRAYQLIYDEYYRDQNLTPSLDISKGSGTVGGTEFTKIVTMRKRAWEKDYFTSALPWAQRGAEVLIPIDVEIDGSDITYTNPATVNVGGNPPAGGPTKILPGFVNITDNASGPLTIENIDSIEATNTSVTINDLRRSVRLQEWLEKNARGGARYVEQILSHFGVVSSDARLQRPEYLGGGKQPVVISEVLSTFQSPDGEGIAQGNMAGHGISVGNSNGFNRRFEEHGYVIGIMSIIPRTAYQQGIPKHLQRFDKLDYAWPEFANLGEQAIHQRELFYDYGTPPSVPTFGYQSRYAEYKYAPSTVHGEFKDSLAFWHMGRIFDSVPALNTSFIESDPTTRIFSVQEAADEHLYCQIYNAVSAIRPLPYFGTPTL